MADLEASPCRFCNKQFRYSGAYDRHSVQEHPRALQHPSASRGPTSNTRHHKTGATTPESDYEELFEDSHPLLDCPGYGFEASGKPQPDSPAAANLALDATIEINGEAGMPIRDTREIAEEATRLLGDPWYPFSGVFEFKHARWIIESNLAKASIDRYFHAGLCTSPEVAFTSGGTLSQQLDRMYHELGPDSCKVYEANWTLAAGKNRHTTYYYRCPLSCIKYLLKQPCFRDQIAYVPVQECNGTGERMYSEMHTADWW